MKTVKYNEQNSSKMQGFVNGQEFEVVKETKKQFIIMKDGREHTIHKNCLGYFTIIN